MTLTLTSQAFRQSGEIPVQNICEGADGRDDGAYGGGNLGYKQRYKEGYFPVPPHACCRRSARRSR
ncbi:hypothetical protein PPGU19_098060 (plasmid) [Paraburkholderia sp. PGU19]|nr:hypothetical protein PPGU19_098060 [Paraburkholderia sp. PGU19]